MAVISIAMRHRAGLLEATAFSNQLGHSNPNLEPLSEFCFAAAI